MNQEHAEFALSNRTSIETNTPSKHIQSTHTHTHTHIECTMSLHGLLDGPDEPRSEEPI